MLAAGGSLDQLGRRHERLWGEVEDEVVARRLRQLMAASHAARSLEGSTFARVGGRSMGMYTAVARTDEWMERLAGCQEGIDTGNTISALPEPLWYLGFAYWGPVPVALVVAVVVLVAVGLFLRYHRMGRAIFAVGGNAEAARAAGINVDRVKIGVFIAAGVFAALGGLLEMGRVQAITAAQGYNEGVIFMVFASAVIGGASLNGGKGNMVGVATGAALIEVVENILDLANVNSYWIEALDGLVILVALAVARVVGGKQSQT